MNPKQLLATLLLSTLIYAQPFAQCLVFDEDLDFIFAPSDCGAPETTVVDVQRASAFIIFNTVPGELYAISLCNSEYPLPPEEFELVIIDTALNILAHAFDCVILFTPPYLGEFLLIFNQIDSCGLESEDVGPEGIEIFRWCPPCLDRVQVTEAILDPLSDLEFFPGVSSMWMPHIDFGLGPGFEGLIPQGTQIDPFLTGIDPFPGPGIVAPFDAYFFWIDDFPSARFEHPTRFVLVDPSDCTPSLSEGSILISEQGWWPVLTPPESVPIELFQLDLVSEDPPGPANIDGLIAGNWILPDAINVEPNPPANNSPSKSAGIVIAGDNRADMRADIPIWRKQLQGEYGVDSSRILGTSNDSAATRMQFCDMLDSLCTMMPAPDTIYIRISTHGGIGVLGFADGTLTGSQLCQKFKKIAKKGVPIMLFIDACHSSSLYDANNWGFPAGSMIIVGAQSGSSAQGASSASQADSAGNAIPNTGFTGGMLSMAHILCRNDTTDNDNDGKTDADTDRNGTVDDCEAFNWVNTQKPCFVIPLSGGSPFAVGSFILTQKRFYPAGPPPGFVPDTVLMIGGVAYPVIGNSIVTPNPMPSYRPVGDFSTSMNFNVQNNTGEDRTAFYMVFAGDVSGGYARAWTSTSTDSMTGSWSSFDDVASTYDPTLDETTVCWMAEESAASNGDYIHFGYEGPGKKLRPKRQHWSAIEEGAQAPLALVVDLDPVPTLQSSVVHHASGSPLTISTANINLLAGGEGHAINYTIGYRVTSFEVPLDNLFLTDPLVSTLPLIAVSTGVLDTNEIFAFDIGIPEELKVGDGLILQVDLDWSLNPNTTTQLIQWRPLDPRTCEDSLVYASGDTIPLQINSSGTITLHDVIFQSGVTTLNAADGLILAAGATVQIPDDAEIYVFDFGCKDDEIPFLIGGGKQLFIGPESQIVLKDLKDSKKGEK